MDQSIFSLINRHEDKVRLWLDLADAHAEILCKGDDETICKLKPLSFDTKKKTLECQFMTSVLMKDTEEYLGHFFLGGEKYYFQGIAQVTNNRCSIPIASELYRLQRRQNYRVYVPEAYGAKLNIFSVNDKDLEVPGRLADLSSQGCKVVYTAPTPGLKVGDKVVANLIIPKKANFDVQGILRHLKADEGIKGAQVFGVEFTPLASITESKLFAITMEIHKEFFRRS